jgi:diaminopimelate epimerase
MTITFWKMTGAGNDFIAIDNRQSIMPDDTAQRARLIARLCRRRLDIGADGVLLIEHPTTTDCDFRMRYYNSDGGEAETCGNGARCIARFAHELRAAKADMTFQTEAGPYTARVQPDNVTVSMSDAFDLRPDIPLGLDGLPDGKVDFLNSGVPHAVALLDDIDKLDIINLGRAVRQHPAFAPAGTNMNFLARTDTADHFRIRTYERGVEDETLACGTGCIASAILLQRRKLANSPVTLTVRGGTNLTVHFTPTPTGAKNIQLQGEARIVCRGEFE